MQGSGLNMIIKEVIEAQCRVQCLYSLTQGSDIFGRAETYHTGRMDIYFVFYNIFRKGKIMYGKIVNAPSFFEGFKKGEIT